MVERSADHSLREETLLILQAQGDAMKRVVQAALARLPVIDLKVEDAPLEDVLAAFFARPGGPPSDST